MTNKSTDPLILNTKNTAILVIDKQRGYIERQENDGPNTQLLKALPLIDNFIKKSREIGIKIIWTQMLENRKESPENIKKILDSNPISNDRTCMGQQSFDFIGLNPIKNEHVIQKKYYDAFAKTNLKSVLSDSNIENVVLIGIYGSRCVLGTAYGANGNDLNVIMLRDLIANPDKFKHEINTASNIVDAILGWSLSSDTFFKILENESN